MPPSTIEFSGPNAVERPSVSSLIADRASRQTLGDPLPTFVRSVVAVLAPHATLIGGSAEVAQINI